jgi:hypothetical protein
MAGLRGGVMGKLRILGISLVIALAAAVFASAAAAEAPEFGRCVKVAKGTGAFKSGRCTETAAGGKFEWIPGPGPNNKFTLADKAAAVITFASVPGEVTRCTGLSGSGEYSGSKTVGNITVTLTGCNSGGLTCFSGHTAGEVVLNTLEGELGVIAKGETPIKDTVGLDLFPVGNREGVVSSFKCTEALKVQFRGSVIIKVPTKISAPTTTLKAIEKKGVQKPERFEGAPRDVLESSYQSLPFTQAGLAAMLVRTNEEKIEINPTV